MDQILGFTVIRDGKFPQLVDVPSLFCITIMISRYQLQLSLVASRCSHVMMIHITIGISQQHYSSCLPEPELSISFFLKLLANQGGLNSEFVLIYLLESVISNLAGPFQKTSTGHCKFNMPSTTIFHGPGSSCMHLLTSLLSRKLTWKRGSLLSLELPLYLSRKALSSVLYEQMCSTEWLSSGLTCQINPRPSIATFLQLPHPLLMNIVWQGDKFVTFLKCVYTYTCVNLSSLPWMEEVWLMTCCTYVQE